MEMDSEIVDAISFTGAVDSAIMSETESIFSFASIVDSAIRSLGTSPVHSFASAEDNATRRRSAARLSQVVQEVSSATTGHVAAPARLFTLAQLQAATNNFSSENMIGFGAVDAFRGKLVDGRDVAVKMIETWKYSIGKSETAFLCGLHHKNLVGLVGFCEKKGVRLLVYEYTKNGSLSDHLHDKGSCVLNSWKMRIKIALEASRGIQYLHNYAYLHIHGDIKSSNILLDATWTARVSDFELSFINPEYRVPNVLTAEMDVYGLGVVLLELLTGKRAIFKSIYGEHTQLSVVAVAAILAGDLVKILDPRVGPPDVNEKEAVELVACIAIHCVNLKLKDMPTIADIVVNLERALAICDSSHDSWNSDSIHDSWNCASSHDSIASRIRYQKTGWATKIDAWARWFKPPVRFSLLRPTHQLSKLPI